MIKNNCIDGVLLYFEPLLNCGQRLQREREAQASKASGFQQCDAQDPPDFVSLEPEATEKSPTKLASTCVTEVFISQGLTSAKKISWLILETNGSPEAVLMAEASVRNRALSGAMLLRGLHGAGYLSAWNSHFLTFSKM